MAKYSEGQSLWSRTTGRKVTVNIHSGNRVMITNKDGHTWTEPQSEIDRYFTPEPQEEIQFVEPEDEPCDLD